MNNYRGLQLNGMFLITGGYTTISHNNSNGSIHNIWDYNLHVHRYDYIMEFSWIWICYGWSVLSFPCWGNSSLERIPRRVHPRKVFDVLTI